MNIKHISKFLVVIFVLLLILSMFCNYVYAGNFDFEGFDSQTADNEISGPIETFAGAIVSVVRIVCTGVAIIMLATVAIKYMSAAPGERAELKKSSVQYVVGAFILFGSTAIIGMIGDFIVNVFPD